MITDALGIAGVLMILAAFFLLVSERMRETAPLYLGLNIVGAALILVALARHFNFAATVMQAGWIAIALAGAVFHRRTERAR